MLQVSTCLLWIVAIYLLLLSLDFSHQWNNILNLMLKLFVQSITQQLFTFLDMFLIIRASQFNTTLQHSTTASCEVTLHAHGCLMLSYWLSDFTGDTTREKKTFCCFPGWKTSWSTPHCFLSTFFKVSSCSLPHWIIKEIKLQDKLLYHYQQSRANVQSSNIL